MYVTVALVYAYILMAIVPQSKKANFDASHELEELLLEDNPLKAKQRKDRDISTLSAEMRQMEEQFTIYDFRQMHRRSYYPHNQQIATTMTATSSTGGMVASRPVTPAINGDMDGPIRMPSADGITEVGVPLSAIGSDDGHIHGNGDAHEMSEKVPVEQVHAQ